MVAAHGFEPRTHRVWTDCSSQLSYAAMYGASDRDWTGDLILTKDTLCRLSYTSTMNDHFTVNICGCGDRTWTCDLRVMSPTSYQLLHPAIDGGGRRIRTFEGWANRFTVCPLWPLGNPSTLNEYLFTKGWCRLPESNWWPTDYKSVALPTELSRRVVSKWGVLYGKFYAWQVFFMKNTFFLTIRLIYKQKATFLF